MGTLKALDVPFIPGNNAKWTWHFCVLVGYIKMLTFFRFFLNIEYYIFQVLLNPIMYANVFLHYSFP